MGQRRPPRKAAGRPTAAGEVMEVYVLRKKQKPERLETADQLPKDGFLWIDLEREEAPGWEDIPARLLDVHVLEQHRIDSLNATHRSFFDGTSAYDQVIFQGLAPDDRTNLLDTGTAACYLFDDVLITIHAAESVSFKMVKERLQQAQFRQPETPFGLLHVLIDTMVNRFLAIRSTLAEALEDLQEELLDPNNPYSDWKALLAQRKQAKQLEKLSTDQAEAISEWRDYTWLKLTEPQNAKLTDLLEHVDRVLHHARTQQTDIESAVQLHFSAVAHRTNEIVRVLTILTAIFMPLSLITGIFGMNFEYMPQLKIHYAYYFTLAGMAGLALCLIVLLRWRRWL